MAAGPSLPSSADELLSALGEHQRQAAALAVAIGEVERSGEWAAEGAVSMAAWLRHCARMSHRCASAWVRRGRLLVDVPEVADAAVSGALSEGQVDAIGAVMRAELVPLFRQHAEALIPSLAPLSVRETEIACQVWRERADALVGAEPAAPRAADLRMAHASDGHLVGGFVLPPAAGAQLERAITGALAPYRVDDTRTVGELQAHALVDVCAFFNAHHEGDGTPRHRPHVELVFEAREMSNLHASAVTSDGVPIGRAATSAMLCDCVLHRVVRSESAVLDYGRRQRLVTASLFRATALRDGGCRFPGCDRPVRFTDAHHVVHWRAGGSTSLDNLCLLCTFHHHLIHGDVWRLSLGPAGEVVVTTPVGAVLASYPRGPTRQTSAA